MLSARRPLLPCAGSAWPGLAPPTTRTGPGGCEDRLHRHVSRCPRLHLEGQGRPAGRSRIRPATRPPRPGLAPARCPHDLASRS